MSIYLKHFSETEIIMSGEQASQFLRFLWPDKVILPSSLTLEDRGFAQALLIEAIDSSYNMGFVDLLFKSFFMKIPVSFASVRDMVKEFAKAAAKHWFKHATGGDLQDPKIYENVRATLARNFKSVWDMKQQTGEIIY